MTIGALETHDIYTIQDLKKHVQGVSGIPWHQIAVWDGQTGLAFDNTHELPDMAYSELEINVLRVYFSFRHSHKSNGAYMAYVCTSSLVKDECAGHGLPVGDGTMIMYGWCIVSLPFDTFECLDVANGDTLYIEDRRTNGLSKTTEQQIVSSK
ncbi:hypothetical protein GGI23_006910 [Coemansia sp. RSA 2559]|nr:hypothetical protein GGI23_006910 [Coemansia sp. RSA 2559]KAJ2853169.1 hypothetical protein GGI22_004973 [Coemansia erecta]